MASAGVSAEGREPVKKVASRIRTIEDYNLAARLQDEEFGQHYALNRAERQQIGKDTRRSRFEQELEDRYAASLRAQQMNHIAQRDEEIARNLQEELEKEEKLRKEIQAQLDAEFASFLQLDEERRRERREQRARARTEAEDERIARELQSRYDAQQRGSHHRKKPPLKNPLSVLPSIPSLPSLPSLIGKPKKRTDGEQSAGRSTRSQRSDSHTELERRARRDWTDSVDEDIQNEVNLQMASAALASQASIEDDPPPPYSSLETSTSPPSRGPRAWIATRDPDDSLADSLPVNNRLITIDHSNSSLCRPITGIRLPVPTTNLGAVTASERFPPPANNTPSLPDPLIPQRSNNLPLPAPLPLARSEDQQILAHSSASGNLIPERSANLRSIFEPASHPASVISNSGNPTIALHPTNPFLSDLSTSVQDSQVASTFSSNCPSHAASSSVATSSFAYNDGFGLPKPSALALGINEP